MNSKWSTQLITGNKEIDEHHFVIIRKLYEVEQLSKLEHSKNEIMDALLFLETYTLMHFAKEEKIMAELACPAAEENKQQHAVFNKYIHALNQKFAQGDLPENSLQAIEQELSDWVTNHIQKVDMKIKVVDSNQ
jgi:hemerythrin